MKLLDDKNISGVALDDSQFVGPTLLGFVDPKKMQAAADSRSSSGAAAAPPSRRARSARPNSDAARLRAADHDRHAALSTARRSRPTTISGTTLNADDVTEVPTDPDNQNPIVVAVKNGGDFQETQVEVQAFIDSEQVGDTGTIPVFDAGTTANVTFKFEPLFNKAKQSVKIVVKPVAGEENTANNSRTYQVIFKFPG